VVRSLSELE